MILHKYSLTSSATWLAIPMKGSWYQHLSQRTNEKNTDKGKINILACHGNYLKLIQNISLTDFLSNIKAEAKLTTYPAAKTTDHNKGPTNKLNKCIVTSGTETNDNTCVPSTLDAHSQEGSDTLITYHALSVGKHAEVVIASPCNAVFLLMVQMYPSLLC